MIEIYFIRHGESVGNKENRFRGRHDFPLNKNGLKQAVALKRALRNVHFHAIYSSPLQRAFKTAEILADRKVPVQPENGFTNIQLGDWENQSKSQIREQYPELWHLWITYPEKLSFPGLETLRQVQQRSHQALFHLIPQHEGQRIAIVSHRAVLKPLFAAMLEIPEPYFWKIHMDTASYSIAEYRPERGFTFTGINLNHHLETYLREDLG